MTTDQKNRAFRVISVSPTVLRTRFSAVLPDFIKAKPATMAMAALDNRGRFCGILAAGYERGSVCIEYVYVKPEFRSMRAGAALLSAFIALAKQNEFYPVLAIYKGNEEHSAFEALLMSNGNFVIERSPDLYRISPGRRQLSKNYRVLLTKNVNEVRLFYNVKQIYRDEFYMRLKDEGIPFIDTIASEEQKAKEYCYCIIRDGKITSASFFCIRSGESVCIKYIYGHDMNDLIQVLAKTAQSIESDFSRSILEFEVVTQPARMLADKMFGRTEMPESLCVARWTGLIENN